MDPVITLPALKAVAGWIGTVVNWRDIHEKDKKAQIKAALESLMTAVRETRQYLAKVRRDPAGKDPQTEYKLSELWSKAGVDMLPINNDVAQTYVMKADYWSDPEGWEGGKKDMVITQLDEVFRMGREILME